MKKKLLTLTIAGIIMLTGCGSKKETTTETPTETITSATSEDTTEPSTEAEEKSLDGLAAYLLDKGVVSGSTEEPMYQYINAIGGFKYLDSDVEVYEYDMTSDTYKSIVDTNEVSGLTVSAINGPYILIFSNNATDAAVIDAFNNY